MKLDDQEVTRRVLTQLRFAGDQTVKQLASRTDLDEATVKAELIRAEVAGAVQRVARGPFWRVKA